MYVHCTYDVCYRIAIAFAMVFRYEHLINRYGVDKKFVTMDHRSLAGGQGHRSPHMGRKLRRLIGSNQVRSRLKNVSGRMWFY